MSSKEKKSVTIVVTPVHKSSQCKEWICNGTGSKQRTNQSYNSFVTIYLTLYFSLIQNSEQPKGYREKNKKNGKGSLPSLMPCHMSIHQARSESVHMCANGQYCISRHLKCDGRVNCVDLNGRHTGKLTFSITIWQVNWLFISSKFWLVWFTIESCWKEGSFFYRALHKFTW